MKVLLENGSPRSKSCTYTALSEVADTLNKDVGHFDLYDKINLIPFDKLDKFFRDSLK